jgi:hypothetical protein
MSESLESIGEVVAKELIKGYPEEVVSLLDDSLTAKGIVQFMHARNRLLGESPLQALKQEDGMERVVEAAQAFNEGSYV